MTGRVGPSVTWGLLLAWMVHDAEELVTMPAWSRQAPDQLSRVLPVVPAVVGRQLPMSRAEAATAVGLMGVVMAAASAAGARTGGQSRFFQVALAASVPLSHLIARLPRLRRLVLR